jgi:hypothetical protein
MALSHLQPMTTNTACETWRRLDEEARGIGLLDRLLDAMMRAALRVTPDGARKSAPISPSEMLVRFGASTIGTRLLRATSCDDLDGVLEQMIESPDFASLLNLLETRAPPTPGQAHSVPTVSVPRWFVERYGRGMAAQLAEGLKLGAAISDAVRQLETIIGRRERGGRAREPVLELVRKGRIQPKVSRALIAALKGIAAFYGMAETVLSDRPVEPWLKAALADVWVSGRKEHLRLLASIPGVVVSTDLIPERDRLELERLADEATRANEFVRAFAEAARKSGSAVFVCPDNDLRA